MFFQVYFFGFTERRRVEERRERCGGERRCQNGNVSALFSEWVACEIGTKGKLRDVER